jgi:hypothetical protein
MKPICRACRLSALCLSHHHDLDDVEVRLYRLYAHWYDAEKARTNAHYLGVHPNGVEATIASMACYDSNSPEHFRAKVNLKVGAKLHEPKLS